MHRITVPGTLRSERLASPIMIYSHGLQSLPHFFRACAASLA